jgi:hypothetical protein
LSKCLEEVERAGVSQFETPAGAETHPLWGYRRNHEQLMLSQLGVTEDTPRSEVDALYKKYPMTGPGPLFSDATVLDDAQMFEMPVGRHKQMQAVAAG